MLLQELHQMYTRAVPSAYPRQGRFSNDLYDELLLDNAALLPYGTAPSS